MEQTDDWYFRNIPNVSSGATSDTHALCPQYNTFGSNLYGYSGVINQDQPAGTLTGAISDVSPSLTFTDPYLETPFLPYGNDPFHVKNDDGLYIDAGWALGTQIIVSRATFDYVATAPNPLTFIPLQETWNPGLYNRRLSTPREAFRVLAYRFQFDNGALPVYGAVFNMYQEFVRGPQENVEKS